MLKQMKALASRPKFISGDGAQSAELIKLGMTLLKAPTQRPLVCRKRRCRPGAAFTTSSKAKFNADVQVYAPFTYDATNVPIAAIQKAGTIRPRSSTPSRQPDGR